MEIDETCPLDTTAILHWSVSQQLTLQLTALYSPPLATSFLHISLSQLFWR